MPKHYAKKIYIGSEAQLSALDGGEWQATHSLEEPFEYTLDRTLGGVMTRTSMVTVVVRERSSLPGIRSYMFNPLHVTF
jgi:hypothetical protein